MKVTDGNSRLGSKPNACRDPKKCAVALVAVTGNGAAIL
jgi:hypothetical protein